MDLVPGWGWDEIQASVFEFQRVGNLLYTAVCIHSWPSESSGFCSFWFNQLLNPWLDESMDKNPMDTQDWLYWLSYTILFKKLEDTWILASEEAPGTKSLRMQRQDCIHTCLIPLATLWGGYHLSRFTDNEWGSEKVSPAQCHTDVVLGFQPRAFG